MSEALPLEELKALLEKAKVLKLIGDAHRTKDYAGRTHGFLYNAGELVPLAAVVIAAEGCSQEIGRARLDLLAAAINALPSLLSTQERLRAALEDAEAKLRILAEVAEDVRLEGAAMIRESADRAKAALSQGSDT